MLRPRKSYECLTKYRPPLEGRGGKMRLDFNENTVGCAPAVVRALRRALTSDQLATYPEYEQARARLARFFRVKPEQLVLTNGTDDAVKVICETFVEPGDVLLVPAPTFPVYQFFHEAAGGRTERIYYDENFRVPLREVLKALKKGVRWVAFANPNNPTGTMVPRRDLRVMLEAAPETAFVVDEAYYEFSGQTVLPWLRKYSNLIVTRTFSKAFGLAALRLGCILTNAETAETMRRGQNPLILDDPQGNAQEGCGQDAQEDSPRHAPRHQHGGEGGPEKDEEDGRAGQVPQPHVGPGRGHHDSPILQPDQGDEKTDAHGDGVLEALGHGGDQLLIESQERKDDLG